MSETRFFTKDVCIDVETLGLGPTAPIVQIGVCWFDLESGPLIDERNMCLSVNPEHAIKARAKIDASTLYWWMRQNDAARQRVFAENSRPLGDALSELSHMLYGAGEYRVWFHGPHFDEVKLGYHYSLFNQSTPWRYNWVRDSRTLYHAAGMDWDAVYDEVQKELGGVKHDALSDARATAQCISVAWKLLHT